MDTRYYHPRFNDIVLDCFRDVIEAFQFDVKANSNGSSIEMWNEKCMIEFIYDSGFASISFVNPVEKAERKAIVRNFGFPAGYPKYPVFSVWKFLYPHDSKNYSYSGGDIEGHLKLEKQLLTERLSNVLNGDFSWVLAYRSNDARIAHKIEYMTNHWELDNPVRIKFSNGDPAWEKAFDEYKKYLDELQH